MKNEIVEKKSIACIGCGPHVLALLCRLSDLDMDADFEITVFEQKEKFSWHPGLLLNNATMQISFLKDLVTPVNPTSKYSFLNYLSANGRFDEFVNLLTFFPYRLEFSSYLDWVTEALKATEINFRFGCRVVRINGGSGLGKWTVDFEDGNSASFDFVVVGAGGVANIPEVFDQDDDMNGRVVHSSEFLSKIVSLYPALPEHVPSNERFLVVGGGQSACEIFTYLSEKFPHSTIDMMIRKPFLQEFTVNKFANRIFMPQYIERFNKCENKLKAAMLRDHHLTTYSGVKPADLEALYKMFYLDKLTKSNRFRVLSDSQIESAMLKPNGDLLINGRTKMNGECFSYAYDMVFLATGYKNNVEEMIDRLNVQFSIPDLQKDDLSIDATYLVKLGNTPIPLALMGHNELTHGVQDSLISNIALKADMVVNNIKNMIVNRV